MSKLTGALLEELKKERLEYFIEKTLGSKEVKEKEVENKKRVITITDDFGCQQDSVIELVKEIIEIVGKSEEVEVIAQDDDEDGYDDEYEIGMIIVLLKNPNSHNYKLRKPLVVIGVDVDGESIAAGIDGIIGNYLPEFENGVVRRATLEEIKEFNDNFKGNICF